MQKRDITRQRNDRVSEVHKEFTGAKPIVRFLDAPAANNPSLQTHLWVELPEIRLHHIDNFVGRVRLF
jgi:hypothetical protein